MKFPKVLVATLLSALAIGVQAAPVVQSQSQFLTSNGQDFVFSFGALPASDGFGGLITISSGTGAIPGLDLSGAFPGENEYFEVTVDGNAKGSFSCGGPSSNGSTPIAGAADSSSNFNDCVFSLPISLTGAELNAFLLDGIINVGVLFGADVSTFDHNDQVEVSLSYNSAASTDVPEPGSLALLGLGLVGLAAARKRKQA